MENIIQSYEKTETSTDVKSEVIDSKVTETTTESISGMTKADISKKYKIPQSVVDKYDFTATLRDGSPKYAILGRANGKFYQIVERDIKGGLCRVLANGEGSDKYPSLSKIGSTVSVGNATWNNIGTTGEATKTTTTTKTQTDTIKTTTTTTEEDVKYRVFDGVKDWQINMGKGKVVGHITARDGYVNINHGDACNNEQVRDLIVDSGYITREVLNSKSTSVDKITKESKVIDVQTQTSKITEAIKLFQKTIASPLVLDMNGDGKVSAAAGKGVDINNDGKADGAATNGDKMLAMTDLNGNGKIDGAEVFGDQTVSPFTGKKLNAANGFEALKQIAQEAKQYTGIDCMNGSKVDVQKLQKALAQVGINLGFVSDDNVTNLENLYGVKEIEVENYKENARTGSAVEHLQQSVYTDENGVEYKVDDVWFEI